MDAVEAAHGALRERTGAMVEHLEAIQRISDAAASGGDLAAILEPALDRALRLVGAREGVLEHAWGEHRRRVDRGLSSEAAEALRSALGDALEGSPDPAPVRVQAIGGAGSAVVSAARLPGDLRLAFAGLGGRLPDPDLRPWLERLLRDGGIAGSQFHLRELERSHQAQQERLLQQILTTQEEERRRVARDLHDTVAQDLAALRLEAERLQARASDPESHALLARLERRSREMLETVRSILGDLRLSILDSEGFVPAVRALLDKAKERAGLVTHLLVDAETDEEPPYELAIALFRVVQEALLNIVQHAGAQHVIVSLELTERHVEVTVEDDGCGFEPEPRPADGSGRGLGLLGMEERVHLVGGRIAIESSPGAGTTLRVRVPRRVSRETAA